MKAPARDIDAYLATVPPDVRAALERLRRIIKSAAPNATETISWQMPSFKHQGLLVGFAAFKAHCSFFPMSAAVIAAHEKVLERYSTSKGTIRFTVDKPLPAALVKKIVKARIAENEGRKRARERKSGRNR